IIGRPNVPAIRIGWKWRCYRSEARYPELENMVDISKLNQAAREAQKLTEPHQGAIEATRQIAKSPAMKSIKALQENSVMKSLRADIERHEARMRIMQGPLNELRLAGGFSQISELYKRLHPAQELIDTLNARFTLPGVPD